MNTIRLNLRSLFVFDAQKVGNALLEDHLSNVVPYEFGGSREVGCKPLMATSDRHLWYEFLPVLVNSGMRYSVLIS